MVLFGLPTIVNGFLMLVAVSGFIAAFLYNRIVHSRAVFVFCLGLIFMIVTRMGGVVLNTPADTMFYVRALSAISFPIGMWLMILDTKRYIKNGRRKDDHTITESQKKEEKSQAREEKSQARIEKKVDELIKK